MIKKYFINLFNKVIDDDFPGMAAEMAFMFALGIFPFMLFLMALFGWLGKKSLMNPILHFLDSVAPPQIYYLITEVLNEVMLFKQGGLVATISILVALFLAANAVSVIMKGLNRAYGISETRNFIFTRFLSLIMVFVNAFVLFLSVNLIIFGKIIVALILDYTQMSTQLANIVLITRWPVSFLALYLVSVLNYYILPCVMGNEVVKRKSVLPGTFFFCTFWLLGSWIFSIYVGNLGTYNKIYGTIGAFAMLMVWLYYTSLIILIGGELNSRVYKSLVKTDEKK